MKQKQGQSNADRQLELFLETFFKGVGLGIKQIIKNSNLLLAFILVTTACGVIFYLREIILAKLFPDESFNIFFIVVYLIWLVPFITLYGFSRLANNTSAEEAFASIKFCNKRGDYPEQIGIETEGKKIIFSFRSPGLTLADWRSRQEELETAFDCNIVKFEMPPHTKQIVRMHTVPSSDGIKELVPWSDDYISDKDFVIVAGQALLDAVEFNLDKYPHALIAGVTGSGKSVILRCLLWQCAVKGAKIYMMDFKGGLEFAAFERFGDVISNRPDALELLKELNHEMKLRLELFRQTGTKNLTEYNQLYPEDSLARIVVVCDEVAEMLDKTGLQAADKAIYYEIERELSSLARLSRAAGINMLLGTQRPDAKVIVGQIKNNLPIRISGRMVDSHASEMVLGNTKAASLGETLGRFLYSVGADTWEFQAFNFKDSSIKSGDYQRGKMLLDAADPAHTNQGPTSSDHEETYEPSLSSSCDDNYKGF